MLRVVQTFAPVALACERTYAKRIGLADALAFAQSYSRGHGASENGPSIVRMRTLAPAVSRSMPLLCRTPSRSFTVLHSARIMLPGQAARGRHWNAQAGEWVGASRDSLH